MQQIKCPKCGEVFTIDETSYSDIANQIKNKEFAKEVEGRVKSESLRLEAEKKAALAQADAKVKALEAEKKAIEDANKAKISEELAKSSEQKAKEIADLQAKVKMLEAEKKAIEDAKKQAIELEINKIKTESIKRESELKSKVEALEKDVELAKKDTDSQVNKAIADKANELIKLKASTDAQLKAKDDTIAFYKDLKSKTSVKLLGENLEQHCMNSFNQIRAVAFPNAYFEKDNDISVSGTKGDFIFRDKDGDQEYISIMFEMKNESDVSKTKHKNEDFFKKLNDDRIAKHCEYAVLVSLLEPESELYNSGIVDVSHKYPKMYVIRPQFFIPLISLLVNAAKNSISYQRQLVEARCQNLDITNFENKLKDFKEKFGNNFKLACDRYTDSIEGLKKTVKFLNEVIRNLETSQKHLTTANGRVDEISIKKLVRGNDTMMAKFEELEKSNDNSND